MHVGIDLPTGPSVNSEPSELVVISRPRGPDLKP